MVGITALCPLMLAGDERTKSENSSASENGPAATISSADSPETITKLEFFEKRIRPLLIAECYSCHSGQAKRIEGSLRLDHPTFINAGGDSGAAIDPSDRDASPLLAAVRRDGIEMPPSGPLSPEDVQAIEQWVKEGAIWPNEPIPTRDPKPTESSFDLEARKQSHWAWKPPVVVAPQSKFASVNSSATDNTLAAPANSSTKSVIDLYVKDMLAEQGIALSPVASREVLIRRLYMDLVGIPPNSEEWKSWMNDSRPNWYEELVDHLLASPQFGVRWGRHWLDLVRYAESRGHEFDEDIPGAFQYRDYVVRALNQDLPYDQFIREQIAGDMLESPRRDPMNGSNESILGTGFWHLGEAVHSPVDTRRDEADRFDNMIDVMSKTFQGLTVSCARCHDHKFDAISTKDYYALQGYLRSSHMSFVRWNTDTSDTRTAQAIAAQANAWNKKLNDELAVALQGLAKKVNSSTKEELTEEEKQAVQVIEQECRPLYSNILSPSDTRLRCNFTEGSILPVGYVNGPAFDVRPKPVMNWFYDGNGKYPQSDLDIVGFPYIGRDPVWNRIQNKQDDSVNRSNRAPEMVKAGQSFITPMFNLDSPELSYLVRGEGTIVAVVDSHRLVNGPLHGETILKFKFDDEEFHWVTHNLKRYQGSRIHVEISSTSDKVVGLAQVADGVVNHNNVASPVRVNELQKQLVDELAELGFAKGDVVKTLEIIAAYLPFPESMNRMGKERPSIAFFHATILKKLCKQRGWMEESARNRVESLLKAFEDDRQAIAGDATWEASPAPVMIAGSNEDAYLLVRGNASRRGDLVPRRFLTAMSNVGAAPVVPRQNEEQDSSISTETRLTLANRIASPDNPLTARVMVNRIWHHLFGKGIVPSTDDFGVLGLRPSNLPLLDYLAIDFVDKHWSTKAMIKEIVLSHVYRQSSQVEAESLRLDPDNKWLGRFSVKRLEGEAIRDSMLANSGKLDTKLGGPSVPVHLTDFLTGRGRPGKSGPVDGDNRRSIYLAVRRNFLTPFLAVFDTPTPQSTMGRRNVSNVPAQALTLQNDPFVQLVAEQWAERIVKNSNLSTIELKIEDCYITAFARKPTETEMRESKEFFSDLFVEGKTASDTELHAVWSDYIHALMNLPEYYFVF